MRQLFSGLFREKSRRPEMRSLVEPMTALNSGHLAVEKLAPDPFHEKSVALSGQIEFRALEIKSEFF
jgi:hypothetical protein